MFWWKNKTIEDKKVTPKFSVNFVEKNGIGQTILDIDPKVNPKEYIKIVMALLDEENIRFACSLFELNGHKNAYNDIQDVIMEKYLQNVQKVLKAYNDETLDEEIVKPSMGISNE